MQVLKFKIKHEVEDVILKYQQEYSSVLHYAFEYLKNEEKLDSLFNYEKGSSKLIQSIRSLNNVELMSSWLVQCAVNEAFSLVQRFNLRQNEYVKKMQRKSELEQKQRLLKTEKKELNFLQKVKEPKLIFGRKKAVQ